LSAEGCKKHTEGTLSKLNSYIRQWGCWICRSI